MDPLSQALNDSVKRPRTLAMYRVAVRDFVEFAGGNPANWTGATVVHWREDLTRRKPPLATKSINAKLAAIRYAMKRAVDLGYLSHDSSRVAEFLPYVREKKRRAVDPEVGTRILSACSGNSLADKRDTTIISLGFYRGLRRESIQRLTVDDVNLNIGTLNLWVKGGRRHLIPLDSLTAEPLAAWMRILQREGIDHGPVFRRTHLCIEKNGQRLGDAPLSGAGIYDIIKRRAAQAGEPDFHPHLMRHCFISWAIVQGFSYEQIMKITGHRSITSILEYISDIRGLGVAESMVPDLRGVR